MHKVNTDKQQYIYQAAMNNDAIVYINLGGTRISAIAGKVLESDELRILGEQTRPSDDIKSGVVEKISGAAYKVNEITKFLQNSLKFKEPITSVSLSLNAKSMKHQVHSVEKSIFNFVSERMIHDMEAECREDLDSETVDVYKVYPLAFYIDGVLTENPVGKRGKVFRVDYNVVVGNQLVKDSIERMIDRTGIDVDFIHLGMEAISTVLLDEKDMEEGCALINFGSTTTSCGIYCAGKLQELFIVPLGGNNITKDIQELGIAYQNAEILKCNAGCAMESLVDNPIVVKVPNIVVGEPVIKISTQFLAVIIEARLQEILEPIFNQIDSIPYPLHQGIVITGGASKLEHLSTFIKEKTGFQVRSGSHADWLTDDTDPKFRNPEYAEAVGSLILTDYLQRQHHEKIETAIESKLQRSNIIKRISSSVAKKISDGMGELFKYDEIEANNSENTINSDNIEIQKK